MTTIGDDLLEQVLEETISILQTDGWCQGVGQTTEGEHCLVDAMKLACTRVNPRSSLTGDLLWAKALNHVARSIPNNNDPTFWLPGWNDDDDRTYEDVVLAVKHAKESLHATHP